MAEQYKIELGVKLKDNAIQNEINDAQRTLKPIEIKVDAETKELTNTIREALNSLSKGTKNVFTLDTSSIEKSLDRLSDTITDIKTSLGTLDSKSGMNDLLSSINQITKALGKAENESDTLVKSLSTLSKKEFGFNFNLKTGNTNPLKAATDYGKEARRNAIPALQEQASVLQDLLGGYLQADKALERYLTKIHKASGISIKNSLIDDMSDTSSIAKQMEAIEKYIGYLKKIAVEKGINLSSFDAQFSKAAENIVDDTVKIQTGAKQTEEALEEVGKEMKKIFGGGVSAEGLSASLEPIIIDLGEIRKTLQDLSKGISLDGLTQSFDRLSTSIENLLANAEKVKGVLGDGLGNAVPSVNSNSVKIAQQTGRKIGETVAKSAKQSINIDDVIDEQTFSLMKKYEIAGGKNSKAFKEIRQALVDYRQELKMADNVDDSVDLGDFAARLSDSSEKVRKVTSTISSYIKVENDAIEEEKKRAKALLDYIKGSKVKINDDIKSEYGKDYSGMRKVLGAGFGSKDGLEFDSWLMDLNDPKHGLGYNFDLTKTVQDSFEEVYEAVKRARELVKQKGKTYLSEEELYDSLNLNRNELVGDIISAIDVINREQQRMAQVSEATSSELFDSEKLNKASSELESVQSRIKEIDALIEATDNKAENLVKSMQELNHVPTQLEIDEASRQYDDYTSQISALEQEKSALKEREQVLNEVINREKELAAVTNNVGSDTGADNLTQDLKQAENAAEQTADAVRSISKEASLVRDNVNFERVFDSGNQSAKEAQQYFKDLLKEEKAAISVKEEFDNSIDDDSLKSFTVDIQRATGEVERLHYALSDAENDSRFLYQGGTVNNNAINKQTEKSIKKANDLQIQLDKIKSGYSNLGANKPIKEKAHIQSLSDQYDEVQKAIENVKNADNATFASMESNAKKEIATLESLVKIYRDAETFSTDLRAKDRDTAKEVYSSRLDVLSSKMKKDGVYTGLESDVSALSTKISGASDVKTLSEIANELSKLDAKYKSAKAAKDEFNNAQNVGSSVAGLKSEIEILQKASPSIKSFKTEINGAEVSIESLLQDLSQVGTKGDFKVVEGKLEAFGKAAEAAGIDLNEAKTEVKKANDAYKQMLEIQKQIRSLSIKEKNLTELGNTDELNTVSTKLKDLKSDYETLKRTFGDKLTSAQFGNLQAEIDETESELKQLDAKFADIKAKLAKDIKLNIELGNYDNQISGMLSKFNTLSHASDDLRDSVEEVKNAYKAMENALDGTGDEVADRQRLIQAEENYARALEKTNNLIRIQAREEKALDDANRLDDKKAALKLDMSNYLKENTRAANEFGDEIRRLSSLLDSLDDDVAVNGVARKFKNLTKEIKNAGKDGLTVFDKLKAKAKEYMSYLSAAEIFMYAEQGLREMFNTVKEIDTAMTGLYRVTDLTAAEYDTLFNSMINSAKEYGATLNDIINATTDWVRAGFDANTSLGLAEVTTMYQHISDLDYDTAAENLITAYNGFKDELNGAFDGDTVGAVNYIADILNELDNNFAVTSAGLGEALTRSASALDLAGNSIQETAGMITGIIEVTQDPEQAGSTLKILSLRLRGMKGQLEELGEETDENVENISKMQGQILKMTGGKVNIFDGAGEFRSTYEIMKDISEVWDDLNSTAQADLLETIAGEMLARIHRNMYIEYI